jgi:hypothetical protein
MVRTVEVQVGSLTLRPDGILHAVIDFVDPPTKETAAEYVAARTELIGSTPPPVILEIVRVPYSERTVRSFLMETMPPPPCRAVVVSDPTLMTIFQTYELMAPQAVPTEVFPNVEAAVRWLHIASLGTALDQ